MPLPGQEKPHSGTLDETIIRPRANNAIVEWRWAVSLLYLAGISVLLGIIVYQIYQPLIVPPGIFTSWYKKARFIYPIFLVPGLALYAFRTQSGWVYATVFTSAILVLSAIGALAELIPGFLPLDTGSGPVITGFISVLLAGGAFYLLSHRKLRAAFRVPRSWVGRCVTLGGMIGTGAGLYLIWLVR